MHNIVKRMYMIISVMIMYGSQDRKNLLQFSLQYLLRAELIECEDICCFPRPDLVKDNLYDSFYNVNFARLI